MSAANVHRALRRTPEGFILAPAPLVAVTGASAVLVIDALLASIDPATLFVGLLDEPAHLLTALLILAAWGRPLDGTVLLAALAGVVLIDVDHVPQYLGFMALTEEVPRPVTHSLATVAGFALASLAARGRARRVLGGISLGVAMHLARDLATGPGVALAWPLSDAAIRIPYAVYAAGLAAVALLAGRHH